MAVGMLRPGLGAGVSGRGVDAARGQQASGSFLKKRTKKLLFIWVRRNWAAFRTPPKS
jgi:hypothetical protein